MSRLLVIAPPEDREALLATGEVCSHSGAPLPEELLEWWEPEDLLPTGGDRDVSLDERRVRFARLRERGVDGQRQTLCFLLRPGRDRYFRSLAAWKAWWASVQTEAASLLGAGADRLGEVNASLIFVQEEKPAEALAHELAEFPAAFRDSLRGGKYFIAPLLEKGEGGLVWSAPKAWPFITARLMLYLLMVGEGHRQTADGEEWTAWRVGLMRLEPDRHQLETYRQRLRELFSENSAGEDNQRLIPAMGNELPLPATREASSPGQDARASAQEWFDLKWGEAFGSNSVAAWTAKMREGREEIRGKDLAVMRENRRSFWLSFRNRPFPCREGHDRTEGERSSLLQTEQADENLRKTWTAFHAQFDRLRGEKEAGREAGLKIDRFRDFANLAGHRWVLLWVSVFALFWPIFGISGVLLGSPFSRLYVVGALFGGIFAAVWIPWWVERWRASRMLEKYRSRARDLIDATAKAFRLTAANLFKKAQPLRMSHAVEVALDAHVRRLDELRALRARNLDSVGQLGASGIREPVLDDQMQLLRDRLTAPAVRVPVSENGLSEEDRTSIVRLLENWRRESERMDPDLTGAYSDAATEQFWRTGLADVFARADRECVARILRAQAFEGRTHFDRFAEEFTAVEGFKPGLSAPVREPVWVHEKFTHDPQNHASGAGLIFETTGIVGLVAHLTKFRIHWDESKNLARYNARGLG